MWTIMVSWFPLKGDRWMVIVHTLPLHMSTECEDLFLDSANVLHEKFENEDFLGQLQLKEVFFFKQEKSPLIAIFASSK